MDFSGKKGVYTGMTKNVIVSIQGLQFDAAQNDEELDKIETIYPGEYYFRNGKHFFLYEDVEEGQTKVTKNIIKVSKDYMELTKKGIVNVHMVFEKNKKNVTYYHTPYGSLLIGIDAYRVDIAEEEDEIVVEVEYELEINNEHVADCHIRLKANPQRSTEFHIL